MKKDINELIERLPNNQRDLMTDRCSTGTLIL